MKRKTLAVLCAAVLSAAMLTGCGGTKESAEKTKTETATEKSDSKEETVSDEEAEKAGFSDGEEASSQDTSKDNADAQDGFYDGLTFHRIMDGFMVQGGDPLGNGTGGADEEIKGEFANNGVENDISHTRGVISMARSMDPNSASSQFFIVHKDSTFLDGDYAGFGHVTEGMDVVDKICEDAQPVDDNGTIVAEEQPVIESITILD